LQAQFHSVLAEFSGRKVNFKYSKSHESTAILRSGHGRQRSVAPPIVHSFGPYSAAAKRYNVGVLTSGKSGDVDKAHRQATYASETTGLLLVAVLLLALTLIRYWQHIHWSWR
jgi:hypothetical protein